MNAHVTAGVRELSAEELDQVTGGYNRTYDETVGVAVAICSAVIATAVCGLLDWLFG
jgi:bacteriocin-like protein